MLIIYIILLEI